MKRKALVCLGMLAWVGVAQAADMQGRRGAIQQPAYYPAIDWRGFYVGINGGGAWGDSKWTSIGGTFDVSGGMIGGTVGYNWQWGSPFVLGLEGDLDWTNIDGSSNAICPIGCKTSNSWLATVRGRIGYAFDRFMPFITGGLAVGDIKASQPGFFGSDDVNAGWTAGGGFEFIIAGRWSAKAEYLYVDLGKFNCGFACGNGFNPDNVSFNTHLVRGGVNFRF
jgi:outer membrane immunogenic protein